MAGLAEEISNQKDNNPWNVRVINKKQLVNPWEHRSTNNSGQTEVVKLSNTPITNPFVKRSTTQKSAFIDVPNSTRNPISHILSDDDFNKLISIESANNYSALNPTSKAYGRYQFIPSTASSYATKLGIPLDQWKTPENQDKMFKAFTEDNIKQLKSYGIPITPFSIYGAHQQGAKGFSGIMSGKLSDTLENNVRSNVPEQYKSLKGRELIDAWQNHWQQKFNKN